MTFTEIAQTVGPMLLQTTLVLTVASVIALALLRISGCRRPWVHQFVWGAVLLLGFAGMRIPFVVPVEIEPLSEPVVMAATSFEEKPVPMLGQADPDLSAIATLPLSEEPADIQPLASVHDLLEFSFASRSAPEVEPAVQTGIVETGLTAESSPVPEPVFTAEIPMPKGISFFEFLPAFLFSCWLIVLSIAAFYYLVRYVQLLRLLRNAEDPDTGTENLWFEILRRHGITGEKQPRVKMLPEGGPAMVRTPRGYTLVLSKSHWNELDTELRRGVMRHELAHFLNGDLWKTFFARLVVLLHWFNPLAHLAARRFEEAIEWSADSFSYGSEEKGLEQFAAAMLSLHETTPQNYRYRVAFGTKDILRRLEFLKRLKSGSKESLLKTGLVLGFSLVLFTLGVLNIRIVAQEKKPRPTMERIVPNGIIMPEIKVKAEVEVTTIPAKIDEASPMKLTVLDADGKPIAGATGHASRVDRDNKRPGANFKTDENGVAKVERTTPENASWACFNIKTVDYTPYFAVWEANREPKYPPAEFTVKLDKAKTIGGTVLDPDGKPVEGVKVEFSFPYGTRSFNDDSTHCAASGRTDGEGRWTCGYVPLDVLGNMRFYLHHPDFQSTQIDADPDDLKTDDNGKYSHVFTIQRGNEINGTVKDENGKPIDNVRVEIQFFGVSGSEKDMYRRTATDVEGRYRFATCPLTDSAAVVAQAPGFAGRYVETPIGSEPKTVDLVLNPSKPLKLRFTDEKGKPIENPLVFVSRWGPFDGTSIAPPIQKMLKAENYEPLKLDDGNGNWIWSDALAGPFRIAVGAEGFMTRRHVDVEVKDEVQTIVLKPWLEVAGTVVDDETGEPIPVFRIAEGYGNVAEGYVSWQRHGKREGKDGAFRYVDNQPRRFGRRLRIEADGYENCESRLIENDEGSIESTFRMKKAEEKTSGNRAAGSVRSGIVLTPDGKPAVEARILVSTRPNGIHVSLDSLDNLQVPQTRTDRAGKFTLPAIKFENDGASETGNRFALVLIHEDGCRYLLDSDFDKNHNTETDSNAGAITLQPWGELEGTLMIANRPGEGSQIGVNRRERDTDSLRFDFYAGATTGKDGKFSIRKLFPGEYSVSRNIVLRRSGRFTIPTGTVSKFVAVESGRKTGITLGGTGRPVIGRVVGTPEAEKLLKESGRGVRIRAPRPPYPEALKTPIEIERIRFAAQNDPEKEKELFAAWQQTEAGKKYRADAEEVLRGWNAVPKKISEDRSGSFGGKIDDDGSFRVEDVESGDWIMEINAFDDENKSRIHFEHPFTVSEIQGGRSDEALDLGTLRVEVRSTAIPSPQGKVVDPPENTLSLTVLTPDGKPAVGAEVEVRMSPRPEVWTSKPEQFVEKRRYGVLLKTDVNGTVPITLSKRPPDRLECFVQIDGATPFYAAWGRGGAEPVPAAYTIRLDKAATVGARFVNEKGEPVKDVVIHPGVEYKKRDDDFSQLSIGGKFRSDAEGNWVFRSAPIPRRSLSVEIEHPDYMPTRASLPFSEYTVDENGKPVKTIVLDSGYTVTGQVADENGNAIVGAAIRATFLNSRLETTTDENGRYRLTRCQPQKFRLFAAAKNHAPEVQSLEFLENGPKEKGDVNFKLGPGGTIRVRVTEKDGAPIPNTRIFFQAWRDMHSSQTEQFGIGLWHTAFNDKTDENGVWTWREAPPDGIRADICAPGKMQLGREHLVPREEEYPFTPPPQLVVTGKVTDAETGEPIPKMAVVPAWFSGGEFDTGPHWTQDDRFESVDGRYRFSTNSSRFAHGFRIEAEGYLPFESRQIKGDEGDVTIDVALQKGKDVVTTVVDAGNRPVADADVLLGIPGSQIFITNGEIGNSTFCDRRKTDKEGRFAFPPQKGRYELIIVHPGGVAWTFCESNDPPTTIALEKWARIEGLLKLGDPNDPDSRVVETRETRRKSVMETNDIDEYRNRASIHFSSSATADADGKFTFDKLLPGGVTVGRQITFARTRTSASRTWSHSEHLNLKPSETHTVVIGGSGRTVIGKLSVTTDSGITPDWNFALVRINPIIRGPRMPEPPEEIRNMVPEHIRNEQDREKNIELRKAWSKTEEGIKHRKTLQEFYVRAEAALAAEEQHRPGTGDIVCPVAADGTFRLESVSPGKQKLFITLEQSRDDIGTPKLLARLDRSIEIPEGKIDEPFDLGTLQMEKTSTAVPPPQGNVVKPSEKPMTPAVLDSEGKP